MTRERVRSSYVAAKIGFTARAIQKMAARGEIPSAARFGRVWTFDPARIGQWIRQREAEACRASAISIDAGASYTAESLSEDMRYERVYEQTIGRRPGDAARR